MKKIDHAKLQGAIYAAYHRPRITVLAGLYITYGKWRRKRSPNGPLYLERTTSFEET